GSSSRSTRCLRTPGRTVAAQGGLSVWSAGQPRGRVSRVVLVDAAEHGGDRQLCRGEAHELDSDPDVALEGERGVPDFTLEPDVDGIADRRDVDEDPAMHEFPRLRMDERQPKAEHRDVDDLAISPHRSGLTINVAAPGPGGRLARHSSAVLHVDPSLS